jgi:hypothetical protein
VVFDSGGGVVPGAKVTLANEGTGFTREATTNAQGQYVTYSLPAGPYRITVEKAGFQKLLRTGVTLAAADALSGVAKTEYNLDNAGWTAYSTPIVVAAEGVHTLLYRSADKTDNVEAARTLTARIDKTAPEASVRFDPVSRDIVVVGSDALSGTGATPVKPSAVANAGGVPTEPAGTERRTYEIGDAAGNVLVLVMDVSGTREATSTQLVGRIISLRYNGGRTVEVDRGLVSVVQSLNRSGTTTDLVQDAVVGSRSLHAEFDRKANQTTLVGSPRPRPRVTEPGLVLLHLDTDGGSGSVEPSPRGPSLIIATGGGIGVRRTTPIPAPVRRSSRSRGEALGGTRARMAPV